MSQTGQSEAVASCIAPYLEDLPKRVPELLSSENAARGQLAGKLVAADITEAVRVAVVGNVARWYAAHRGSGKLSEGERGALAIVLNWWGLLDADGREKAEDTLLARMATGDQGQLDLLRVLADVHGTAPEMGRTAAALAILASDSRSDHGRLGQVVEALDALQSSLGADQRSALRNVADVLSACDPLASRLKALAGK